ncbi:hypothetical protein DB313_06170 (plasmid) [Borrelia turcica IST7]|uniref:Outer surface protein n=1 Tax=Borrelia turcica IST7 TaxID=1104446 RepID=A0A386PQB9_9SPIR|nr:BBA14 family lipoprotein [Borrelia turcica]AYE37085.1 hypothetical protein DB313_06170 [Borrelia turcica IST7]
MRRIKLAFIYPLLITISCTTIASLPQEPDSPPKDATIYELSIYEARLSSYVMYLQTFLIKNIDKLNAEGYKLMLFNPIPLKEKHTIKDLLLNISHFKDYIRYAKPIANSLYQKYSKLK